MSRSIMFLCISLSVFTVTFAGQAVPLTAVNSEWVEKDPWLSPDGYTLYFSSNRDGGDFNIFASQWDGIEWSSPVRLSALINSEYDETQPSLSRDGTRLLFISFRGRFVRGAWISQRQPDGSWGKARLVNGRSEPDVRQAVIGADGRSIFFTGRSRKKTPKPYGMCMKFNAARRFWKAPVPHNSEPPKNVVPGARWRFSENAGDVYIEPTGVKDPDQGNRPERLNAVASSSIYGREDEDLWVSEAQNLVDGLVDTSWISRSGMPVHKQWVLFALNGSVRYAPGLSRIHSVRIHTGPVEQVKIEKRDKKKPHVFHVEKIIPSEDVKGTGPKRVRILGGMKPDALRELALVTLDADSDSPRRTITIPEPAYLRYLKIEIIETVDPGAPFVAFNEIEAFGAGLSASPPVHRIATDENANVTVDGTPFFPVYIYYAESSRQIADLGFNTALELYDLAADSERLAILDRAADLDLKVIGHVPWVETEADRKRARNQLLAARHHPALLGYLMSDESGHNKEVMQRDERRAAFIRRYDPHHFTMLNDLYPQNYPRSSRFVDVFSIDPYPHIVGQPYSYQAFAVDAARKSVGYRKPVFVVNASWGPIVSPVENRLNVYLALIHGAKGISWYAVGVRRGHPDHWRSIIRCVGEINRLTPVLLTPPARPDSPLYTHTTIENPSARIDTMIKEVNGEVWLLAANCAPREARVRFSFGWAGTISIREVMTDHPEVWSLDRNDFTPMDGWPPPEDRKPVRKARPIELVFPPYGVRVFRMKPSGPVDACHTPDPGGRRLSMVNESFQRTALEEIKKLRSAGKQAEAKNVMNRFWSRYGDRLADDDLAALMDEMSDHASFEEIAEGYGRLAERNPGSKRWPAWVFTIIKHAAAAGRKKDALPWLKRLVEKQPDSLWRANAEVLIDPSTARSGRKPWAPAKKLVYKPVIDGKLDENLWRERISFKNTVFLDASKHPQATEFSAACDDDALYLAVKVVEPQVSRMRTFIDKDDRHVWADDSIVVYLDPTLGYDRYAQFIFNSAGVMWDGWGHGRGTEGPGSLNAKVERKSLVVDGGWQIEIRIPFSDLGRKRPGRGQVWGLGLQRWRHVEGSLYTVWGNREGTSLDNRAETFGFLVFE